jgi:hypothetical protein
LLAIHGEDGVALRGLPFLYIEERLAVECRKEDGEEPGSLLVPPDGDGAISGVEIFPLAKHGDGARLARTREARRRRQACPEPAPASKYRPSRPRRR